MKGPKRMQKHGKELGDGCHLECKQQGFKLAKIKRLLTRLKRPTFQIDKELEDSREFVGPVKVVLVTTPKREYRNKNWGAAFITLGFFLVGATTIIVFFFTLSWTLETMTSLHILLFTAGFQLLTPVAFFTMNIYNGSSNLLKSKHKKIDYFILKVAALTAIISAIVCSVMSRTLKFTDHITTFKNFTPHGGIGALAVILSFFDIFTLICIPFNSKGVWPRFALVLCIPSFLLSSVLFHIGWFYNIVAKQLLIVYLWIDFALHLSYNITRSTRCARS
ncbi:hypothetical protein NE865_01842 [Phthorimaea operculella]|nr:hypothetical protein NE865_01842 [Phthorimaea operculella]